MTITLLIALAALAVSILVFAGSAWEFVRRERAEQDAWDEIARNSAPCTRLFTHADGSTQWICTQARPGKGEPR